MQLNSPIKQAKLFYYQLSFCSTMHFNRQQLNTREGLILQLQDLHGHCRFGEIAPLPGFSHENLQQATTQTIALLNNGLENLQQSATNYPSVQFALDCALQAVPLTNNNSNLDTVPLLQGDNNEIIKQYRTLNLPTLIKLKVARQTVHNDILLFRSLHKLNPSLTIRCDANQRWSEEQACYFFTQIDGLKLDYIEEPTSCYRTNLQLAEKYQISLALDETLQERSFNYQHHAGIKALILKPTLIGSLQRLQHFIDIAEQQQLQVHISSAFESIIGLQQLHSLAERYQNKCPLSLGIDTLKYFHCGLLTDNKQICSDLQQLECLWRSN